MYSFLSLFLANDFAQVAHDDVSSEESKEQARKEKLALPDLFKPKGRPSLLDLVGDDATSRSAATSLHAIPCSFLADWRRWIRTPIKQPRPQKIDLSVCTFLTLWLRTSLFACNCLT